MGELSQLLQLAIVVLVHVQLLVGSTNSDDVLTGSNAGWTKLGWDGVDDLRVRKKKKKSARYLSILEGHNVLLAGNEQNARARVALHRGNTAEWLRWQLHALAVGQAVQRGHADGVVHRH